MAEDMEVTPETNRRQTVSPVYWIVVVAIVYGLACALGRWGLDNLFGFEPITYVSLGVIAAFGYLNGSLMERN